MRRSKAGKVIGIVIALAALVTAGIIGVSYYLSSSSIHSLLTENHELNKAISNLTTEEKIGFATIQSQSLDAAGELETVVRFVQTEAANSDQIVSEQLFTIKGDTIFFDALIVKFTNAYVTSGQEKALFLWRRIYGESTAPGEGELIEIPNTAPERYYSITKALKLKERAVFWTAIWDLANAPEKLAPFGIQTVFGNAIYVKMEPGHVYIFRVTPSGQIYPEVSQYF